MKRLFRSTKTKLALAAVLGAVAGAMSGEMAWSEAIKYGIGAIIANILGIAAEDTGAKIKTGKASD